MTLKRCTGILTIKNMSLYITALLMCLTIIPKNINSLKLNKPYDSCSDCQSDLKPNPDVEFHLYTRKNPNTTYILQFGNETSLAHSAMNRHHQMIIIIHGFGESALTSSSQTISDAHLNRNEYNVIRVDWSTLAAMPSYLTAARNVKIVGIHIAQLIKWLESRDAVTISEIHIIGFSLGAHVAGFAAKELEPQKVNRITGLDPAGPLFEFTPASDRLDKSDATFVDIIHTYSKLTGIEMPIGHVDFYPNQGKSQPGCTFPDVICSHRRAWAYYAESVLNERGFPSSKCETWTPNIGNCTKNPDAFMGFSVDQHIQGIFLLETKSQPPFAINLTDYTEV